MFGYLLAAQQTPERTPFALLLPAWTAKWLPWRTFLSALSLSRARLSGRTRESAPAAEPVTMESAMKKAKKLANLPDDLETKAGVFYVAPGEKYEYAAAVDSRSAAPFFGVWFCGGFADGRAAAKARKAVTKRLGREGGGGAVYGTLGEMVGAGVVVGVEEEARERLEADPEARRRRDRAIERLEEERAKKGRNRNYEERGSTKYEPRSEEERKNLERLLKLQENGRCCEHFFLGKGCVRGRKCRFVHDLEKGEL